MTYRDMWMPFPSTAQQAIILDALSLPVSAAESRVKALEEVARKAKVFCRYVSEYRVEVMDTDPQGQRVKYADMGRELIATLDALAALDKVSP